MSCSIPAIKGPLIRIPGDGAALPLAESALILAGGKGKRLGYDKKNIELLGVKVFDRIIQQLRGVFREVLISSNDPVEGYAVLPDALGSGPLAGIYQGLLRCSSEYLYVIACDMPFISNNYIAYMKGILTGRRPHACVAGVSRSDPAAALEASPPRNGCYEPMNAFYHKQCAAPMEAALRRGEYRIITSLEGLDIYAIPPETLAAFGGGDLFFNINTVRDLERAQRSRYDLSQN
ncbi:MAG: molybdenum cofactor guanylyltransferase [Treponema sp.]|jgi:molybdopterin-guanine dinucleotide biosynthesis protein A|nr:molybdenum cofactor guanylyltransferase [Treponema sp.]